MVDKKIHNTTNFIPRQCSQVSISVYSITQNYRLHYYSHFTKITDIPTHTNIHKLPDSAH